jgi:hypothetical protein
MDIAGLEPCHLSSINKNGKKIALFKKISKP